MKIQVKTDSHIEGSEEMTRQVEKTVKGTLGRFGDRITRVEVHLSDENSTSKSWGEDKRCLIEVRPAGQQPVSVSHQGATLEQALKGSVYKVARILDDAKGRLEESKGIAFCRWPDNLI